MPFNRLPFTVAAAALALLSACGGGGTDILLGNSPSLTRPETAPTAVACPTPVPTSARCLAGKDSAGAYYLVAMPKDWNGTLVLHAHGGPSLDAPTPDRATEDLVRWAIMVKAGYAWAGSTFRQGGVEVSAAAEDTERLRRIFRDHVAVPKRVVLHGQSWGAGVAAKGAEMYTAQTLGTQPYDAVLLTSGVLAGGSRSYDFRLDLRVVYQYLCNNHPRPSEPAYPLAIGLPASSTMTQADLNARTAECLALEKPAAQRTAEQQRKVQTIADVIRIPASSIQAHLNWGTFHFQDVVHKRTGGASPFGNIGVQYRGSADDATLNAGVLRYRADPAAVQRFSADTDPTGRIPVPVISVKWISDPTAFVELDSYFKSVMQAGGSADRLVQTFTSSGTHSYISDPTYPTLMSELLQWTEKGIKPDAASVARQCPSFEAQFGAGCTFAPGYTPAALETRVPVRERP
ncbi:MAG: hypothetical protein V4772_25455 [Pseudomonadota bacterium]